MNIFQFHDASNIVGGRPAAVVIPIRHITRLELTFTLAVAPTGSIKGIEKRAVVRIHQGDLYYDYQSQTDEDTWAIYDLLVKQIAEEL